jgi:high frequency lysogenization protein
MKNLTNKTIALAGIFQSASMVSQIASKGVVDIRDLETAVRSTLNLTPSSTLAVYGNMENLRTGFHVLCAHLGEGTYQRDANIARYVISLLNLSRKLSKNESMLATIAQRLNKVQEQTDMFGATHDNTLSNLASIYSDTISKLSPRVIVTGEDTYLTNPQNADKIRAILLAGVRAGILWLQVGGSRWQILLKRRFFVQEATRILENEMNPNLH